MGLFSKKPTDSARPEVPLDLQIAGAHGVGKSFSKMLELGYPLSNFHWINAAANGDPWDEGEEVVDLMLDAAERWDSEVFQDEVMPLLQQIQAIEQGTSEVTNAGLLEIERRITGYLRADMWTAVSFARHISPTWGFHYGWDGSPDVEEPVLFNWMRRRLHLYSNILMATAEGAQMSWAGAVKYAFDSVIFDRRRELRIAAEKQVEILLDDDDQ